ncbi:hypothetical protein ACMFMG_006390 [Clarireedia jacksonii]
MPFFGLILGTNLTDAFSYRSMVSSPVMAHAPQYHFDESFIDSESYNLLPRINLDEVDNRERLLSSVRAALLEVISAHDLNDIFSIHLLHKHYDVPTEHVMVYEQDTSDKHSELPFIEICRPRSINNITSLGNIRGRFFYYHSDTASMRAYEYTTEAGVDLASGAYDNFLQHFTQQLILLEVQHIFALSISSPSNRHLSEIEVPQYNATLSVEQPSWISDGFSTDWWNKVKEAADLNKNTGSFRMATSGTKKHARSKTKHGSINFIEDPKGSTDCEIMLDGRQLDRRSPDYDVLMRARHLIVS